MQTNAKNNIILFFIRSHSFANTSFFKGINYYYVLAQKQIDRASQADLVSFPQSQGEQLTRIGNEYRWKQHDSLTIRGNKRYRHSQSTGGDPIGTIWGCVGHTLLLCFCLFKTGTIARSIFKLRPRTDRYINLEIKNAEYHQQTFSDPLMILRMVGVPGFEPGASWTRTKRDTKLRHTP